MLKALTAAFLLIAALIPSAQAGQTLDRVMSKKLMVAVTDQGYPPFSFLNDNNEIDGFDIDVAREVAKRLGVKLRVESPGWQMIVAGKWQGRWDVCICSMTPTTERAQVLDFPVRYYSAPASLLVSADNTTIHGPADITGRKIGVESGTVYERYLQKALVVTGGKPIDYPFGEITLAPYDTEEAAFQDLALGGGKRLDAVIANSIDVKARVAKDKRLKIVGPSLFEDDIFVANDKGDPEWNAKITSLIAELKADGTLSAISKKWVGDDVSR
jgi:polar amino acid transport system substrate-binding protein